MGVDDGHESRIIEVGIPPFFTERIAGEDEAE
jgi:hypothetical protein